LALYRNSCFFSGLVKGMGPIDRLFDIARSLLSEADETYVSCHAILLFEDYNTNCGLSSFCTSSLVKQTNSPTPAVFLGTSCLAKIEVAQTSSGPAGLHQKRNNGQLRGQSFRRINNRRKLIQKQD